MEQELRRDLSETSAVLSSEASGLMTSFSFVVVVEVSKGVAFPVDWLVSMLSDIVLITSD